YLIAPGLIWIEIAVIPIVFLVSNYFRKHILKLQKEVRARVADIYTFIQEWLYGIRTVKAYSLETSGEEKFRVPLRKHLKAVQLNVSYNSWFPCVMQIFRAIVIALSIFFAANNGTRFSLALSAGTLAAVADLIGRLFSPIEALAQEFQTIQQAIAGIARVKEFSEVEIEDRVYEEQHINKDMGLEIQGVTFAYDKTNVLRDIDVSVKSGEKSVFIGRSGAGKTTLLNIVAGLYPPGSGIVRICGVNPYTLPPLQRRRLVGVVTQMPQIFNGTIRQNITLGDDSITEEEIVSSARLVGLHELILSMNNGYDTVIGEGEAGLSSGEVQLLSLARAIAANPRVLLLDEPTSGMDSQTEQRVFEAIRMAGEGRTILSISHRLSGVVDADWVYLMSNGVIVESGRSDELEKRDGWYSMYQRIEDAGWSFS
ncbi:MAG: ABC transporter ATP-binding protein/permease, partial [Oscillospiraceae bacterium]|nr:ABC transporter ATP-binding protein/permease [Oscillospiraceae bacterium]